MLTIIPAVDIKGGKAVRLRQGRKEDSTVYFEHPFDAALTWQKAGAEYIHLVDLDAAFEGRPVNAEHVREILSRLTVPAEIGGGIRDIETVNLYMEMGIDTVILGTAAVTNTDLVRLASAAFPGQVAIGIDAVNGKVATDGWVKVSEVEAKELALRMQDMGVAKIIYTDIHRDGMLKGPNLDATFEMASVLDIPVVLSGGISTLADIKNVCDLENYGVTGVIVGKALFDGAFTLAEAIQVAKQNAGDCGGGGCTGCSHHH